MTGAIFRIIRIISLMAVIITTALLENKSTSEVILFIIFTEFFFKCNTYCISRYPLNNLFESVECNLNLNRPIYQAVNK